jgi:hypothetical protein
MSSSSRGLVRVDVDDALICREGDQSADHCAPGSAQAIAVGSSTLHRVSELLVPVDLSHGSWRVLPVATSIARRLSIPVVPLFVDVSTVDMNAALGGSLLLNATVAGEPVSVEVVPGSDVVHAIQSRADRRVSVVVLSAFGSGALDKGGRESICLDLLRTRDASVVAVGPKFDAERHADVRRVVVCIDSAAPDTELVRDALGWAEALGVGMLVVTVEGRGRSRPGEDETYQVLAAIFEDLPPTFVAVTAEVLDEPDVATAIVAFANRRPGTLLALAPGADARAVHSMTHSVTTHVARETGAPMLLRWHRPGAVPPPS